MNTKTVTRPRIETKNREEVKTPKNYRVILLNNEITAYGAVVETLKDVFQKSERESVQIMYHAHMNGRALVMISTKEICEIKEQEAKAYCAKNAHRTEMGRNMGFANLEFIVEEDSND